MEARLFKGRLMAAGTFHSAGENIRNAQAFHSAGNHQWTGWTPGLTREYCRPLRPPHDLTGGIGGCFHPSGCFEPMVFLMHGKWMKLPLHEVTGCFTLACGSRNGSLSLHRPLTYLEWQELFSQLNLSSHHRQPQILSWHFSPPSSCLFWSWHSKWLLVHTVLTSPGAWSHRLIVELVLAQIGHWLVNTFLNLIHVAVEGRLPLQITILLIADT